MCNVLLNNGGYNKIFLFMFLNISNILYICSVNLGLV